MQTGSWVAAVKCVPMQRFQDQRGRSAAEALCWSASLSLSLICSPSAFIKAINATLMSSTRFTALPPASLIGHSGLDAVSLCWLWLQVNKSRRSSSAALDCKETPVSLAFQLIHTEDQREDESSCGTCIPSQPEGSSHFSQVPVQPVSP